MINDLYVKQIDIQKKIPDGNYINALAVVKYLCSNSLVFRKPVTFFVGENGIGKSTLIEALAISLGFNPEGGSKNFNFSTADSHSDLHNYLNVCKGRHAKDGFFLRAESFYNVASNIDQTEVIKSYGGVSLHAQSHGESFMALVENRFRGNGIYILDEPEAALSPSRIMRLMCCMNEFVKKDSQFIISTHSPILMAFPNADIYELNENGIKKIAYKETGHYNITKSFIENPDRMFKYLFENE